MNNTSYHNMIPCNQQLFSHSTLFCDLNPIRHPYICYYIFIVVDHCQRYRATTDTSSVSFYLFD
uniref:Uncharacterized protein n=1 Tax=Arundo donax TaxID=35708 RepID=A0A0A8ZR59_ARUDO